MAPRTHPAPKGATAAETPTETEQATDLLRTARLLPPGPAVNAITEAVALLNGLDLSTPDADTAESEA